MEEDTIVIIGGSYNPPTLAHVAIARAIAEAGYRSVVVPCGMRPDKPGVADVEPPHRAAMCDMAFHGIPNLEVDLFDLERRETFMLTHDLDTRYRRMGFKRVIHAVGADQLKCDDSGLSVIERKWFHGPRIWRELEYLVVAREGYSIERLPPKCAGIVRIEQSGLSSTDARERVAKLQSLDGIVPSRVTRYIDRYELYRGRAPRRMADAVGIVPKFHVIHDARNEEAARMADRLSGMRVDAAKDADYILVIGGDGSMLESINKHWRLRVPFVGINAGYRGYLTCGMRPADIDESGFGEHFIVRSIAQLRFQAGGVERYAFNDVWLERASRECAHIEVKVNGEVCIPALIGDGLLMATPAGSTSYARSMGANPLHFDAKEYLIVGNNVDHPYGWKQAALSPDDTVQCRVLKSDRRPVRLCADGPDYGIVEELRVSRSRVADVELAFLPHHDINKRRQQDLFPRQ